MPHLEIALFLPVSPATIPALLHASAHRLELCSGPYSSGGLTPPLPSLASIRAAALSTPLHCMLRPRAGTFVYTEPELATMRADLVLLHEHGADGVVFGILTSDGEVDVERCRELCGLARTRGLRTVFHRAFDEVGDWSAAMEAVADGGFDAVLSAGGTGTAEQGKERLKKMVRRGAEVGVEVVVGGGVRSGNLEGLVRDVGAHWWHSAALVDGEEPNCDEVKVMSDVLRRVPSTTRL